MNKRTVCVAIAALLTSACSTANLGDRLGTMKNPSPVLEGPGFRTDLASRQPLILANYNVLLSATEVRTGKVELVEYEAGQTVDMRRYLNAGFALSDIYCDEFFRDAEESQRRRRYGRAITNDVGTAITTILGLANAGQDLVTGAAAGFGFGDSLWRNYDEAFVVSPDLSNVRSLVLAAQDVFRKRTYEQELPGDYSSAQSVILRYANQCSTLGMQSLLNQSANQQEQILKKILEPERQVQEDGQDSESNTGSDVAPTAIPNN